MILDLLLDLQLATLLILLDGKGLKTVYLFIYLLSNLSIRKGWYKRHEACTRYFPIYKAHNYT